MEIYHSTQSGEWTFDPEAMRAMIEGRVLWRRCFSCEGGRIWVDGVEGEVVSAATVDDSDDPDRYYQDSCDVCHGVSYIFIGE